MWLYFEDRTRRKMVFRAQFYEGQLRFLTPHPSTAPPPVKSVYQQPWGWKVCIFSNRGDYPGTGNLVTASPWRKAMEGKHQQVEGEVFLEVPSPCTSYHWKQHSCVILYCLQSMTTTAGGLYKWKTWKLKMKNLGNMKN